MRTTFAKILTEKAKNDKDIILLLGDVGFSVFEDFKRLAPERIINMGVSEQHMAGLASGLSFSGKKVYVYSIIPFITLRCLEQIKTDICFPNKDIVLVGVGAGFAYGSLGMTHHSIEDIGVLRCLPNMKIICPADPVEIQAVMKEIEKIKGPVYIRLNRDKEPVLHKNDFKFELGKGIIMREGKDICLIANGTMLKTALELGEKLNSTVISMPTVKPIDKELIKEISTKYSYIFTLEEHNVFGGLGTSVSEVLSKLSFKGKFEVFGVEDKFAIVSGTQEYLREINNLSPEKILTKILNIINT